RRLPTATMSHMGTGTGRESQAGWTETGRQVAASAYAPAATAALLAVLAALQALPLAAAAAQSHGVDAANLQLTLLLLSLIATLPRAVLARPSVLAAVVMTAANTLSMLVLHGLTVASAAAQLIVLYVLGRSGRQLLAGALTVPYLLLAIAAASTHLGG